MTKRRLYEVKGKCLFVDTKRGRSCGEPTAGETFCTRHKAERARLEEVVNESTPLQLDRVDPPAAL